MFCAHLQCPVWQNWPFHLTFSVKFLIPVPRCLLLSIGVMSSNNIYIAVLRSVCFDFLKASISRESFECSFAIWKWCLKFFELKWHISGSTQKNLSKISMHEAVHTMSLINLSFNSNMSNSDRHLPLNKRETLFENGLEWDLPNPDPFAPKKFSNLSPEFLVEWIAPTL